MGQQMTDWTVIERPPVKELCEQASRKVARQYDGLIEFDDLLQEAYIAVATQAHIVKGYLAEDNVGYLSRWVWSRVTDVAKRQVRHAHVVPLSRVVID